MRLLQIYTARQLLRLCMWIFVKAEGMMDDYERHYRLGRRDKT